MAFTDFYMNQNSGASDLNSGSTAADGGGTDAPTYTSTSGNWDGTSVFTPTDSSTPSSTVSVGMWASIYATGATSTTYVGQITAVGAGVNGTITLSTTAIIHGSVPSSNSGSRNIRVGGAWTSAASFLSLWTTGTISADTRVNIKAATYASTSISALLNVAGTTTAIIWFRGYQTTPGDQDGNYAAVAGTTIPSFTFTSGYLWFHANYYRISNIDVRSSGGVALAFTAATNCICYGVRCTSTWSNSGGYALSGGGGLTCVRCIFTATTTASNVIISSTGSTFIGCVVSGGIIGLSNLNATGITISCTVFTGQAGDSITFTTGYGTISNCSFYAPSGNGINWTGIPSGVSLISNCYFEAVSGVGKAAIMNSQGTNTSLIVPISNAYYNCTANISGLQENFTVLDLGTLASAGFVSGSGGNFAPATVLQDIGFPGGFEAISAFKGYMTPGAVTPQNTGGGGTTYIFNVES